MERKEICRHIDEGAIYYLRLLGNAKHMEYSSNEYYSVIRPKCGEEGASCVFDIRLEHLPEDEIEQKVNEIQKMDMAIWWGVDLSEKMQNAIWKNQPGPQALTEPNDEEACMAMLQAEKPVYGNGNPSITVRRVENAEDFRCWAAISNQVLSDGYPIVHPQNHYHLCEEGTMPCYIGCYENTPVAVAATLNHHGIASLEFVATLKEYQGKGLGKAICSKGIDDAFKDGAKIITLRSTPAGKKLYLELGFKIY